MGKKSEFSDSEEESKKYSLKEMSKSTSSALDGIFYFARKIKLKPVGKDKMDLVNSVVSVHGKDCPEISFYGAVLVRDWFEGVYATDAVDRIVLPPAALDSLINASVQSCVNAINFFKTKDIGDSSLLHAPFALLYALLSRRLCDEPPYAVAEPARRALADLMSSNVLGKVSIDAAGIMLASASLMVEIDSVFVKKEIAQFSIDYIQEFDTASDAPDTDSALAFACMYLGVCLGIDCEQRAWVQQKLLAKPVIVETVCSALPQRVNERQFLFLTLRLVAFILNEASETLENDSEETGGLFGTLMSSKAAPQGKAPDLFETTDLEPLEDIFSAYTSEQSTDGDAQVILAIAAIARSLCVFYSGESTTRATAVFTTVKRWAVSCLTSSDALVVAIGLSLAGTLHAHSTESVSQVAPMDTMRAAMDVLGQSWSVSWGKTEAFALVQVVARKPAADSPDEFSDLINAFVDRFKFHYLIMSDETLKQLFFKSVSMKEAFARLAESLIAESVSYPELVVVSRVMLQMVTAVKAKNSLGDFQTEVKRAEADRLAKKLATGSIIAGLFRAVHIAVAHEDLVTAEILVNLVADLVDARSEKLNSALSSLIPAGEVRDRCVAVLGGTVEKRPKVPDLTLPDRDSTTAQDCVSRFLARGTVAQLAPLHQDSDDEAGKEQEKEPEKEPDTWMDSAANWFLDMAGDDEEEAPKEEKPKKKKKKKVVTSDDDEISKKQKSATPIEEDVEEEEVPVVVKKAAPLVAKAGPPTAVKAASVPTKTLAGAPPKALAAKAGVVAKAPVAVKPGVPAVKGAPVVKKVGAVPTKAVAKPPAPKAAPPPVEEKEEEEEAPKEKKKKKKEEPEEEAGLGAYLTGGLGGWFGAPEPEKPKKEKKKKKVSEDEEEEEVAPPPPKAVPKVLAKPPAKAPVKAGPPTKAPAAVVKKAPVVAKAPPKK